MKNTSQEKAAKVAGFVFLFIILTYICGEIIISQIVGTGDFTEKTKRIISYEQLYRSALSLKFLASICTVILAFTLYVTLKPVNKNLAQLAMYWRLGEAFIGGTLLLLSSFMTLNIYSDPKFARTFQTMQLQALSALTHNIYGTEIYFSFGSLIFFYLFLKSRYIPAVISVLGIFASIIITIAGFTSIIFPKYINIIQFGWMPMFAAEIIIGMWLLFKGINTSEKVLVNNKIIK
jgi:hypothetical protein